MLGATGGCKNLSAARGLGRYAQLQRMRAHRCARAHTSERAHTHARTHTLTGTTEREEGVTSELSEDDHLRVL